MLEQSLWINIKRTIPVSVSNAPDCFKRSAYLRFIKHDYLEPLPIIEGTFDLLLGIFAGGISKSCKRYLKRGGRLISNNQQNDSVEVCKDDGLRLISVVEFQSGQYVLTESRMDAIKIPVRKSYQNALRQTSRNVEYIERETYYVFERTSA